jgi:hypothetical protein
MQRNLTFFSPSPLVSRSRRGKQDSQKQRKERTVLMHNNILLCKQRKDRWETEQSL